MNTDTADARRTRVLALLTADTREDYVHVPEGQVRPRTPPQAFRGGLGGSSWTSTTPDVRRRILDATIPLGSTDIDALLAKVEARAGSRGMEPGRRLASSPRPATVTPEPEPAVDTAPVVVEGPRLVRAVVPCHLCGDFIPARAGRPVVAYCGNPCSPKRAKHSVRRTVDAHRLDGYS